MVEILDMKVGVAFLHVSDKIIELIVAVSLWTTLNGAFNLGYQMAVVFCLAFIFLVAVSADYRRVM